MFKDLLSNIQEFSPRERIEKFRDLFNRPRNKYGQEARDNQGPLVGQLTENIFRAVPDNY